jgi:broad specificity phosphatase PhoE
LVRERCFFTCDLGSPRSELSARWPGFEFGALPERWWPEPEETEEELQIRCDAFRSAMATAEDWPHVAVVSHWGFIRGLTGQAVTNGTLLHGAIVRLCEPC